MKNLTRTIYTVERLDTFSLQETSVREYLLEAAPRIAGQFGNKFDWRNIDIYELVNKSYFLVCKRNDEITGHLICAMTSTPLDPKVKILRQIAFNVKPDSGRTAYHLFHKFVDIGKSHANHVITMLTSHTNIKPATLEKWGFKELETLYRLEI